MAKLLGFGLVAGPAVAGKIVDDGEFFVMFMVLALVIVFIFGLVGSEGDGAGYTGIQVTPDGVAIGGIRFAERRSLEARRRRAIVPLQHSRVFSCPWGGVREIYVEEDRKRLRQAARRAVYGRGRTELGNLSVRWMRAALFIRVDLRVAALPEIRRADSMVGYARQKGGGFHQELWIVPTRRPAELRRVLAAAAEAGVLRPDPR